MLLKKTIELAKKLKALADRGVNGEKENALEALQRLMKKHNLSFSDIEENKVKDREFSFGKYRTLCVQVIASISEDIKIFGHRRSKNKFILEITDYQFLELEAKFQFYKKDYIEKEKLFLEAYIQKNRLFGTGSVNLEELTKEEIDRILKISKLTIGIEKAEYLKRLNK